jgi:signal peptidase I
LSSGPKVSRAVVYALLILLIVAGASYVINSRAGGIQVYDVYPTPSMVPTLEVGDLVVVQSVPLTSLHPGQVIVFGEPAAGACTDIDIVHRIVNITSQGIYTQGDNRLTNPQPDGFDPVPASCVRGVVLFALPYLGKISEAFPPPLNYILVAIIIIVIFMIELLSASRKQPEEVPTDTNASKSKSPDLAV